MNFSRPPHTLKLSEHSQRSGEVSLSVSMTSGGVEIGTVLGGRGGAREDDEPTFSFHFRTILVPIEAVKQQYLLNSM